MHTVYQDRAKVREAYLTSGQWLPSFMPSIPSRQDTGHQSLEVESFPLLILHHKTSGLGISGTCSAITLEIPKPSSVNFELREKETQPGEDPLPLGACSAWAGLFSLVLEKWLSGECLSPCSLSCRWKMGEDGMFHHKMVMMKTTSLS